VCAPCTTLCHHDAGWPQHTWLRLLWGPQPTPRPEMTRSQTHTTHTHADINTNMCAVGQMHHLHTHRHTHTKSRNSVFFFSRWWFVAVYTLDTVSQAQGYLIDVLFKLNLMLKRWRFLPVSMYNQQNVSLIACFEPNELKVIQSAHLLALNGFVVVVVGVP